MATLIIFAGLPGVGKTTLCRMLAKKIRCYFFDSDEYAKKSPLFKKITSDDPKKLEKARLKFYDTKVKEVKRLLKKHKIVIMDAVFDKEKLRKKFYSLVKLIHAKLIIVEVVAPYALTKARIIKDKSKTRPGSGPASRLKVYKIIKKGWEPIKRKSYKINSSKNIRKQLDLFLKQNNILQ